MLSVQQLSVGYSQRAILRNVYFRICRGEFHVLIGANGSGKSTFLRTIVGLQPPLKGDIFLENICLRQYSALEIARCIALNLTVADYSPFLTVEELYQIRQSVLPKKKRVPSLLLAERTQSTRWLRCPLKSLSDGERQKVWVISALAQQTPLLFFDEPTAFMDIQQKEFTYRLLKEQTLDAQKAVLMITHDVESALRYATHVWIITSKRDLLGYRASELSLQRIMELMF